MFFKFSPLLLLLLLLQLLLVLVLVVGPLSTGVLPCPPCLPLPRPRSSSCINNCRRPATFSSFRKRPHTTHRNEFPGFLVVVQTGQDHHD